MSVDAHARLLVAVSLVYGHPVWAADASAALPLRLNASLVSRYVDRGVDVSEGRTAVQGGADWDHESGAFLGSWASSYSYRDDDEQRRDDYQLDLYAGRRWAVGDDVTMTASVTRSLFGDLENNTEVEVGITIGTFTPRVYYDIDFETLYAELVYEQALSDRLTFAARAGYYLDSGELFDELDLEDEAEVLLEGEDPYDFGVELAYAISEQLSVFGLASYQEAEEEVFAIGVMVEI